MIISFFIVFDDSFLDTFRGNIQCQVNITVLALRGGENTQFYCIQGTAGIAACHICEKFQGIIINHGTIISHTLVTVVYRTKK